jgi:lipopolysaccharide transport system permease protein
VEAATTLAPPRPEPHVIRPASRWPTFGLRELWMHRELLYFLAWRELKVRYKQTMLGITWAVLQPVMYMLVFNLFFNRFIGIYTVGPYALVALAGSVIWLYFANSVTLASGSLTGNAALLTKVYFPRLFAPLAPVVAGLVDLALSFVVLLLVMAGYGYYPDLERAWMVIPFLLLAILTAAGMGAFLSALNVKYRDVRFVVPFLLQLWLFASAVFYLAASLNLDEPWDTIFWANPMAGVVEGFRWSLLGGVRPTLTEVAVSAVSGAVLFVAGMSYFKRTERVFADIV